MSVLFPLKRDPLDKLDPLGQSDFWAPRGQWEPLDLLVNVVWQEHEDPLVQLVQLVVMVWMEQQEALENKDLREILEPLDLLDLL